MLQWLLLENLATQSPGDSSLPRLRGPGSLGAALDGDGSALRHAAAPNIPTIVFGWSSKVVVEKSS